MKIETYLKKGQEFILIEDYDGLLEDDFYVEGAIIIENEGVPISGFEEFDLVDQLWCYYSDSITNLEAGLTAKGCFPDQPLFYKFSPLGNGFVKVTIDDKTSVLNADLFIDEMVKAGIHAFNHLLRINPSGENSYTLSYRQLEELNRRRGG